MESARELYQDLQASIMGNQETSYNKLGRESKGLIRDIQKIDGGSLKDIYIKGMPSNYEVGGPVVNPTTAIPEAPMSGLANLMAMKGRDNDSMLVHLSPTEVSNLNKISGNTMTINPDTGLPEGRSRFLEAALPAILSIGAGIATGGMSTMAQMAAAAAASGVGAKLTGKSDEEALNSALLGGATAGIFGGTGTEALKGATAEGVKGATTNAAKLASEKAIEQQVLAQQGKMAGEALTTGAFDQATKTLAAQPMNLTAATTLSNLGTTGSTALGKEGLKQLGARAGQDATNLAMNRGYQEAVDLAAEGGLKNTASSMFSPLSDVGETIKFGMSEAGGSRPLTEMLSERAIYQPLATQATGRTAANAYIDKMTDDYNKPYDDPMNRKPPSSIDSIAFNESFNQPSYTQKEIVDNYMGSGGMNFLNQSYGQEGGQVAQMNQGGLTQFNSIMGNPALQLQNPNPPMQMAAGGDLGNYIPSVGIIGGLLDVFNKKNKNKKQGNTTNNYYATGPDNQMSEVMDMQVSSPQAMAGGGLTGAFNTLTAPFQDLINKIRGGLKGNQTPAVTNNYYGTGADGQPMLMDGPPQQTPNSLVSQPIQAMAGGGMMGDIPPEMLEMLKSQASAPAPADTKAYDVLASIGGNPMQQMAGGGMTQAGQQQANLMSAMQPVIQRMAAGQQVAFEGPVEGPGNGMSDDIPFSIEGQQPALLARDEYVIPADVVSMIGNGSSDAGSETIDQGIAGIRKLKYGRAEQPRETEGLLNLLG